MQLKRKKIKIERKLKRKTIIYKRVGDGRMEGDREIETVKKKSKLESEKVTYPTTFKVT